MDEHYTCDGVVLHSDSELPKAESFCERVNSIDCGDGHFPNIVTFDRFSAPNLQIISNLDRAVQSGGVVFCSEEYYEEDPFGYFSANVAMLSECNFMKMKIRKEQSAASSAKYLPSIASFTGMQVEDDWSFSELERTKLRKLFGRNKSKAATGMPELPGENCLDVANPSMPSTTRIPSRDTQGIAGDSLESESGASEVHPQYPGHQQNLQAPQLNSVLGGTDHTTEGTYSFSGEQANADESQQPATKPDDMEPVIAQDPSAVATQETQRTRETRDHSGHTIIQTESQAPLIPPVLHGNTNLQQRDQSPRSYVCSSDCSLCSILSRCSTKSYATCGAILGFVFVFATVIGISVHFSNRFPTNTR